MKIRLSVQYWHDWLGGFSFEKTDVEDDYNREYAIEIDEKLVKEYEKISKEYCKICEKIEAEVIKAKGKLK